MTKLFGLLAATLVFAGCKGGSPPETPSLSDSTATEPADARLELTQTETDTGTELTIKGDRWGDVAKVYVVMYPSESSLGEVYGSRSFLEIGFVDVRQGSFRTALKVDEAICFLNGDCLNVSPGDEFAVSATIRTSDRSTSSVTERFVLEGMAQ